ncbi:MAG: polymer-forming cytoskeletal protein [Planctomycetota bacterium]
MARVLPPKTVQCYHCAHRFEVGGRAQSTSCPGCNKPVMVADQVIDKQRGPIRELKTCGKVTIKKRGRLICHHIVAHAGLECEGIVDAKTVISGMPVILGKKSNFKGDLTAPAVVITEGATIQPSLFAIGPPIDEPPPSDISAEADPSPDQSETSLKESS